MHTVKLSLATLTVSLAAGCTPAADDDPDPQEAEEVARVAGRAVVGGGGAVATMQTALSAAVADDDQKSLADVRMRVEDAIAAMLEAAACLSIDWVNATATVGFDDCVVPGTGEVLDGSLGVRLRVLVPAIELTLGALTLGDDQLDGTVMAYRVGPVGARTLAVDADVTLVYDDTTLAVRGLDVDANLGGVSLTGSADVAAPSVNVIATADALHWDLGDCLPSSGTVAFDGENVDGAITFLATTPATGEVRVEVPPLPAVTVAMFEPCQSSE